VGEFQLRLGIALQEAGQNAEADLPLRKALELQPNKPRRAHALGVGALRAQQFEQALQHFEAVLRLAPTYEPAHINRALALCEVGRFNDGLAAYQRAIDLSPDNADAWMRRASALFARGLIGEAIRHALRAVHLAPGMTDAHVLLGKLHGSKGVWMRLTSVPKCSAHASANRPYENFQAVMLERRGDIDAAKSP